MIRNISLLAVFTLGLAACMGGGATQSVNPDPAVDPGDALANPTDGFENEVSTE